MTKTLNKYVAFLLIVSFVLSLGSVVNANQINSVAYKYAHSAYISCDSGPNSQYEDVVLLHMYTSTVWGDSGGPLVKTASGSIQYVIGILAGGSGYYSYFTKASNILSAMNGWIY